MAPPPISMFGSRKTNLALIFPLVGLMLTQQQTVQRQANRPPSIDSFASSLTAIRLCHFFPDFFDKPVVTLVVNATDPDGDSLNYEYSTAEGIISGKGKSVVWDLRGLPFGPHEVRVTVTDRK